MSFSRFSLSSLATMLCLVVAAPSQAHGLAGDLASANPPAKKIKGSKPAGAAQQGGDGDGKQDAHTKKSRRRRQSQQPPPPPPPQPSPSDAAYSTRDRATLYFGGQNHDYGFELSFSSASSKVQESAARFNSVSVGSITDHTFLWGVQGTEQARQVEHTAGGVDLASSLTYGGLFHGYIIGGQSLINVRTTFLFGGGKLDIREVESDESETFGLYVFEPLFGVYFNLLPVLRLGFDLSYRYVVVDEAGMRGESYSGVSGGVSLRGGGF
jgi:hypothetical protein